MDFGDLDDLSGDMDFGELEDIDGSDRSPSKIGVAKDLAKEAGTGFLDSLARKTAKKSLPPEYDAHYTTPWTMWTLLSLRLRKTRVK